MSIKVELLVDPKDFYTSGDVLSGKVKIHLDSEQEIATIGLKLHAQVQTSVTKDKIWCARLNGSGRPDVSKALAAEPSRCESPLWKSWFGEQKEDPLQSNWEKQEAPWAFRNQCAMSSDTIYCEQQVLFPTKELAASMPNKSFTLAEGDHFYSFSMPIPSPQQDSDYPQFPSTVTDSKNRYRVVHSLDAAVTKAGYFATTTSAEHPFVYIAQPLETTPAAPLHIHLEKPLAKAKVRIDCSIPKMGSSIPGAVWHLPISLRAFSTQPVGIVSLKIWLLAHTAWTSTDIFNTAAHDRASEPIMLYDQLVFQQGTDFDLSELVRAADLKQYIPPSVKSKLLDRAYSFHCRIMFAETGSGEFPVEISEHISVVSPLTRDLHVPAPASEQPDVEPGKIIDRGAANRHQNADVEHPPPYIP